MFRWIIVLAGLAAVVALFVLPGRATKTSYVNGLPPYTELPGREFIFERDCYIFKLKDAPSDWPFVGDHARVGDLPETVDSKLVGTELPTVRLLDTVRVGDRFKIASVRRDQHGSEVKVTFELLFTDEAARKYPRVDATWIMDHAPEQTGKAPSILADYAVPRRDR